MTKGPLRHMLEAAQFREETHPRGAPPGSGAKGATPALSNQ